MKIEIDLDDLGFHYDPEGDPIGNVSLRDAVIQGAVDTLLAGDFGREVRTQVTETVNTQAHERAAEVVAAVFSEPIQRTTRWGEKQGDPTTVREIVKEAVEQWIGKPPARDSIDRRFPNGGPYKGLTDLINVEVSAVLTKDLLAEVARVKKDVADQIRDRALAAAAASLSPHVR